jgi:hypothetical protein
MRFLKITAGHKVLQKMKIGRHNFQESALPSTIKKYRE